MNNNQLPKNQPKTISRNVIAMGIVSFFNDTASEMIFPVLPLFLTGVLGTPMIAVGLIEGVAEAAASIFKVLSGWLSDRTGRRKPFIVFGYSLSTASKLLFGFATSWPIALIARTSDRFGKGTRTAARDALIAESTVSTVRGHAFGFHRAMDGLGATIGPLITLTLLTYASVSLSTIFLLAFIPGIISVAVLIFFVREVRATPQQNLSINGSWRTDSSWRTLGTPFFVFLGINALFAVGNSSDAFIILRTQALGLSLTHTILLYSLYLASFSLASLPAGILSDRIGPRRVMVFGFLLFSGVYFMFGTAISPHLLWVLLPLYGFYLALTDGVGKAYIAHLVPSKQLGTAYGIFQVTIGLGNFAASLIAGYIWTLYGSGVPFIIGSITALIAALLFLFVDYTTHINTPTS
jgi:MFS family permease